MAQITQELFADYEEAKYQMAEVCVLRVSPISPTPAPYHAQKCPISRLKVLHIALKRAPYCTPYYEEAKYKAVRSGCFVDPAT